MGELTSLTVLSKIVELTKLDYMHRIQGFNSNRCVYRANLCTVKAMVVLAAVTADEDILKSQGTSATVPETSLFYALAQVI